MTTNIMETAEQYCATIKKIITCISKGHNEKHLVAFLVEHCSGEIADELTVECVSRSQFDNTVVMTYAMRLEDRKSFFVITFEYSSNSWRIQGRKL